MKNSKIIIFVFAIIFMITGCRLNNEVPVSKNSDINKQLTQKEKLDDFEYMYTILKENYPYFEVNKRLNGEDWLGKKDEYINRIKATSNDESFFTTLNSILSELHNGHTEMLNKNSYYSDKKLYEKYSKRDETWLIQLNSKRTVGRYASINETEDSKTSSKNTSSDNVKTMDLEKGKTAYLGIHSFNNFNIDKDMEIIKPYLEQIKNYKDLIIDIRGNGGGDDSYWINNIVPMLINEPLEEKSYLAFRGGYFLQPFVENRMGGYNKLERVSNIDKENLNNLPPELKEDFKYYLKSIEHYEPKNPVGFKGKIYLLVDKGVFSSSEEFAIFAKSTGFATLVGEKTGGDGIGIDPAVCSLPSSGYVFRFPQEMGLVSDGSSNFEKKTEPDIEVSAKKTENIFDDPAIQAILKIS